MPKTIFTGSHGHLVAVLTGARKAAGLTQAQLAERVGKDQSFVSIIEGGQRRVDALEFAAISRALGRDPVELYAELVARLPADITI